MLTYNDIVQANGFLTDKGSKMANEKFLPVVKEMLSMAHSESEIRVMASILSSLVGRTASNLIQAHHDETEHLNEMSDEEFFNHMKSKYENFDVLTTPLTPSEARRCQVYWHKKFGNLTSEETTSHKHFVDPFGMDEGAAVADDVAHKYNKLMSATNDAVMDILEKTKKKLSNINTDTASMLDEFLNNKITDNPDKK